jgi:serine protease inhibitor
MRAKPCAGIFLLLTAYWIGALAGDCVAQPVQSSSKSPNAQELSVEANNSFAIDLYHQLAREYADDNIFFSPYSVSSVLMMAAEGARYETAAQMGKALRFPSSLRRSSDTAPIPWDLEPLHEGLAGINAQLQGPESDEADAVREEISQLQAELQELKTRIDELTREDKWPRPYRRQQEVVTRLNWLLTQVNQYELRVGNALWGEKTYPFRLEFVEAIERHYQTGGVFEVDFKVNYEQSRQRINTWVSEQTNHRIPLLIPPGAVNALTRLVLTNAVYFKGEWSEPFGPNKTRRLDFSLANGDTTETFLMRAFNFGSGRYAAFEAGGSFFNTPNEIPKDPQEASRIVKYPGEDGFAMLELPYKGDQLSMVLIAPNRPDGLPDLEGKLTSRDLHAWIEDLKQREVHVMVPKFKLETDYAVAAALQGMGMIRAFKDPRFEGGAQFDGMTTTTDPNERLQISAVLHRAFVEVNEKGTEAAAATALTIAGAAGLVSRFRSSQHVVGEPANGNKRR